MSNTIDTNDEEMVSPDSQEELGQEEVSEDIGDAPEAEVDFFDWSDYGDQQVKVVVAGEEISVPLKEALSGYQRQADYTRKTQELGEQRRQVQYGTALQEALQNDPRGTLELLGQHYGAGQQPSEEDELFMDPMEKQYKQLESRLKIFEEQKALSDLEKTVDSLSKRYGNDFDANEVVGRALALGTSDLESVYKQMAFDKIYEEGLVARQAQSKREGDIKQATSAKRQASVVSGGGTAKSASVSSKPITSLRDAFEAAKREHNA